MSSSYEFQYYCCCWKYIYIYAQAHTGCITLDWKGIHRQHLIPLFPNDEVKVPGSEMTGPQGHRQLCEFQTQSVHVYCVPPVNVNSPNTVSFSKSSFLPRVLTLQNHCAHGRDPSLFHHMMPPPYLYGQRHMLHTAVQCWGCLFVYTVKE